jgi:hypothetical protein
VTTTIELAPSAAEADSVKELRADEQHHAKNVQRVYKTGVAAQCSQIAAFDGEGADKRVNPRRPYLTWQCCEAHRELAAERAKLNERAERLGVETYYSGYINNLVLHVAVSP